MTHWRQNSEKMDKYALSNTYMLYVTKKKENKDGTKKIQQPDYSLNSVEFVKRSTHTDH